MALRKKITLDNGISLNYHRIASLHVTTNVLNTIEVKSYVNQKQRTKDAPSTEDIDVYTRTQFLTCDYDQNMSVVSAYEYLKTLPEFEGATDVLEDGDTTEAQESEQTA